MGNSRAMRRRVLQQATYRHFADPQPSDKVNAYRCRDCHGFTVTIDIHVGITPMMIACRVPRPERVDGVNGPCHGQAESMMYMPPERWPDFVGPVVPTWEWYRPDGREADRIRRRDPAAWSHLLRNGLLLRKRTESTV